MDLLNKYFSRLTFEYLEEKQGYSIYAAAVYNLLGGDKVRIVFLFVPGHIPIVKSAKINELKWQNLQARTCPKETYKLRLQDWNFPTNLRNIDFNVANRNKNYTVYSSSDPNFHFQISMIHNPKKKTIYQYPNQMNLHWAIDQWNTVFNYVVQSTVDYSSGIETSVDDLQLQEIRPPSVSNPMGSWMNNEHPIFELI